MDVLDSRRRLLLVHAHPDDETIGQGATMAKYAARGTQVTLVTCTLGEEGEVLVPELAHLAADKDDALGEHRDHRARQRDEGARGHRPPVPRRRRPLPRLRDGVDEHGHAAAGRTRTAPSGGPTCSRPSDLLVEIIREVRPQVLVTYDEYGGYGHPDHIQAHRVATYAAALAAVPVLPARAGPAWDVAKIYWGAMSSPGCARACGRCARPATPRRSRAWTPTATLPPFMVPDELLSAVVDGADFADAKMARDAGARHPDRRRRPVLRAVEQPRQRGVGHRVLPARQGRARADRRATASRPTCSPAWTDAGRSRPIQADPRWAEWVRNLLAI